MRRITKEIFNLLEGSSEKVRYDDEVLQYLYDETTYDVDRYGKVQNIDFPDYDYFNDYIMDIDKNVYDDAKKRLEDLLNNVKFYNDSEGSGTYLELSDNHTMRNLDDNGKSEEEWYSIIDSKSVEFENETGVPLRFLGRSARHICVDISLSNIVIYDKLKEVQNRLEDEAIAEFNGRELESTINESEDNSLASEISKYIRDNFNINPEIDFNPNSTSSDIKKYLNTIKSGIKLFDKSGISVDKIVIGYPIASNNGVLNNKYDILFTVDAAGSKINSFILSHSVINVDETGRELFNIKSLSKQLSNSGGKDIFKKSMNKDWVLEGTEDNLMLYYVGHNREKAIYKIIELESTSSRVNESSEVKKKKFVPKQMDDYIKSYEKKFGRPVKKAEWLGCIGNDSCGEDYINIDGKRYTFDIETKEIKESDDINGALADDIRKVADIEPGSDEDSTLDNMNEPRYGVIYDCMFRSGDIMARQYQIQSPEGFSLLLKLDDSEPGTWIDVTRVEPDDWTWEFNQYIFSKDSDRDREAKERQDLIDEKYGEDVLQIIYDFARYFKLDKDDLDESNLSESDGKKYIKDYFNYDGEIDLDVTDDEVDMLVAYSFDMNSDDNSYYSKFMKILANNVEVKSFNNGILVCKFSDYFRKYNSELAKIFDLEDDANLDINIVMYLEDLIPGNADEDTYKLLVNILEEINESLDTSGKSVNEIDVDINKTVLVWAEGDQKHIENMVGGVPENLELPFGKFQSFVYSYDLETSSQERGYNKVKFNLYMTISVKYEDGSVDTYSDSILGGRVDCGDGQEYVDILKEIKSNLKEKYNCSNINIKYDGSEDLDSENYFNESSDSYEQKRISDNEAYDRYRRNHPEELNYELYSQPMEVVDEINSGIYGMTWDELLNDYEENPESDAYIDIIREAKKSLWLKNHINK